MRKALVGAFPGFPVEVGGVGATHAAFLTESRTRGRVRYSVQEIQVAPSYSAQVRFGEPGAPVQFLVGSVRKLTAAGTLRSLDESR
jgi:hypothetical protein